MIDKYNKRMRGIVILFTIVTACLAYGPDTESDCFRNSVWQPNNVLIKLLNFFYDSIALTSADTCFPQRRFVSVITFAKTILVSRNSTNFAGSIEIAKIETEKQLNKPAAPLAGPFRGIIDRLLNVIDQPINDVLASCKPETYDEECQIMLKHYRTRHEKQCKGYYKNVEVYNSITNWANQEDTIDYIEELTRRSNRKESDTEALDFFENAATKKYRNVYKEFRDIFMQVKNDFFNCNSLTFINTNCI
ncbi:unnamed protein product [Parnassius apollo]|uniref:(apollo) hypothetical protein n=1 Tax=Parnassius apollo TaxID=110799 RepID=A0A8S3YBK9_PARAO|nr:unnamed protein product [Parnassius apollo]